MTSVDFELQLFKILTEVMLPSGLVLLILWQKSQTFWMEETSENQIILDFGY